MNKKVLLVDDEPKVLAGLRRGLGNRFDLHCATGGAEALALLESRGPFAAIVSDMRMPGMDGLALLREIRRRAPDTVSIVLSGYADFDAVVAAVNEGAIFRFHTKPAPADMLGDSIESALLQYEKERERRGQSELTQRLAKERAEFQRALAESQLRLFLQPQRRLADACISGAEALVRWAHPERGLLLPGEFLHVAESAGLVSEITAWMLDAACAQARRWRELGLAPLRVAVNITAMDLAEPSFPNRVRAALDRHEVAPQWLELEITEAVAIGDLGATRANLAKLAALGIELSIDDFGAGYSSFGRLRRLPVRKMKIDRMFIQDIATEPDAYEIVQTLVALAAHLTMGVIAEGVETEEQIGLLKRIGCDVVQGYVLAKPMPADEFTEWLAANNCAAPAAPRQRARS